MTGQCVRRGSVCPEMTGFDGSLICTGAAKHVRLAPVHKDESLYLYEGIKTVKNRQYIFCDNAGAREVFPGYISP